MEVGSLHLAAAELDERIYSLMRTQEEDVKVNGPRHPGLLEPMLDCLRDLKKQSDNLLFLVSQLDND